MAATAPAKKIPKAFEEVIFFVVRSTLKNLIKEELKKLGVQRMFTPETAAEVFKLLASNPDAMLVVDWEYGYDTVYSILKQAYSPNIWDGRFIYLLAAEPSTKVVAIATEFGVTKVHTGDTSRTVVKEHVDSLLAMAQKADPVRAKLLEVVRHRGRGDWNAAKKVIEELFTAFPDNDHVAVEMAVQLIHNNEWKRARHTIQDIAVLERHNLRAQNLFARCLMKVGEYDKAIQILQEANLIGPKSVERLVSLGNCFLQSNKVKRAHQEFSAALQLEPENKEAIQGVAACNLLEGDINAGLGLLRSMSTPEELASVFNQAGIICMRQKKYSEGMQLYEAALGAVAPQHRAVLARLLFNMGVGYFKWDKLEKAKQTFEKALSLDPSFKKAKHNANVLDAVAKNAKARPANGNNAIEISSPDDLLDLNIEDETIGF